MIEVRENALMGNSLWPGNKNAMCTRCDGSLKYESEDRAECRECGQGIVNDTHKSFNRMFSIKVKK